ncbi:kinesin-domain-containing protein [Aspergillus granulosus]|uniref:Kinesin-like protein n=1 Tax=Aspergillus granulosus TaxID=176169 RepID=A0ABR4HIS8_9EURO
MYTRSKHSARRTGQPDSAETSLNQKTAHTKDSRVPIISKSRERKSGDETAIYVTVRCRNRSEREKEEDRAVILRTDGIKGKTVEVSMGSLSNKTYNFDRVFSSAADQRTVYEDTVLPMVNELILGYNCTAFAYGQTGTGKTYTMSGGMSEEFGLLSDNAGIIPRTLYTLFDKLKGRDSTVKCSFIELYNEILHDLLSDEEDKKLQLFESDRNGANGGLLVKGMQESFIDSPSAGIQLLKIGGQKRQVAATECNDMSSRSHTIFTINVITRTNEDSVMSGKLNLVDLAGSENIQRSGAENKRAVEAGQINRSLLTLGRVINALVDRSSHIPYRESKLTRLLQDSLGGQTKTCIIATVSPCQSSQEETISTLEYAFRAKNIHNRPQINTPIPKDTMLSELALEIEKLKRNLTATRHRNGIYMTSDTHEDMIKEIESRRIINEEQKQRIEALESGLQYKTEELLTLTRQLRQVGLDNEQAHARLTQVSDALNKAQHTWDGSVAEVSDITEKVETRMKNFQACQMKLLRDFSTNLSQFLNNEMLAVQRNQGLLFDTLLYVEHAEVDPKTKLLQGETEKSFHELKQVSERVRAIISEAWDEFSQAITRVSEGVQDELLKCNNQFNLAYDILDEDVQTMFQMIVKQIEEQGIETSDLRHQLQNANSRMKEMNNKMLLDAARLLEEERRNSEAERHKFLAQIGAIYDLSSQQRWNRLQGNYGVICSDISSSGDLIEGLITHSRIDEYIARQKQFAEELVDFSSRLKLRMGQDKKTLGQQHLVVGQALASAKKDLQQSVENCEEGLYNQVELWAQKLEKTQSQNSRLSDAYLDHLNTFKTTINQSYLTLNDRLETDVKSSGHFQKEMALRSDTIEQPIAALEKEICVPLLQLRTSIRTTVSDCTASLDRSSLTNLGKKAPQDFHDRPKDISSDDVERPQLKRRRL